MTDDELAQRLLCIVPNAKFALWKDEPKAGNKGYTDIVRIDGVCVVWYPDNTQPMPTAKQLAELTKDEVDEDIERKRKVIRNDDKMKDLTMVACYNIEKKGNPGLLFPDYLDSLEASAKDMQKPA